MSPKEVEIKLTLPAEQVSRIEQLSLLRRARKSATHQKQLSVYFDTNGWKLKRRGLTLRVRRIGDRYVQTIKSEGDGLFDRGEWEADVDGPQPDPTTFQDSPLQSILSAKTRQKLRPIFETLVDRTSYPLKTKSYVIDVTLDRGEISTGDKSIPVLEAELELKSGRKAHLFAVAKTFAQATFAELAVKSKAERGYELVENGDAPRVTRADEIELTEEMSTRAAFQAIARSCLKQLVANKAAVLNKDPEGVHQLRIGLRRLRAAISLFSNLFPEAEVGPIKAELKWLTNELGPVRQLDVILDSIPPPIQEYHSRLMGMDSFSDEFAGRRAAAMERAIAALCSPRFGNLTLDVASWIEVGPWLSPRDELLRDRGLEPIKTMASAELQRRWQGLQKKARNLADMTAHRRHKLRIAAKKLRYATEFFETLFADTKGGKRRATFLSALKTMQDRFGDLNDVAAHEALSASMAESSAQQKLPQTAFAAGVLTGRESARFDSLLSATEQSCKDFRKAKPYWK